LPIGTLPQVKRRGPPSRRLPTRSISTRNGCRPLGSDMPGAGRRRCPAIVKKNVHTRDDRHPLAQLRKNLLDTGRCWLNCALLGFTVGGGTMADPKETSWQAAYRAYLANVKQSWADFDVEDFNFGPSYTTSCFPPPPCTPCSGPCFPCAGPCSGCSPCLAPQSCFGTAGTAGTGTGCLATAGTYGCLGRFSPMSYSAANCFGTAGTAGTGTGCLACAGTYGCL
jgi:hypothetical protein